MNTLPQLTDEEHESLHSFQLSLPRNKTVCLDPSNAEHRSVIAAMLNHAGRSSDNYPLLHGALANGESAGDASAADEVHMVDAGQTANGKTTATVWSVSKQETAVKGGNLLVFDHDDGSLLAQGENTAVKRGFLACPTRGATSKEAGKNLDLLYVGHATNLDKSTRFFAYANQVAVAGAGGIQATVEAPVSSTNENIEIAIGRTKAHDIPPNSDYIYYSKVSEGENPYLIVPFVGNVALSGTIDIGVLTIANLETKIFINNGTGTSAPITRATEYTTDADMVAALSVGGTPNILSWDFPYDGKDHGDKGYQDTKSIVYNHGSLTREIDSYFYFAFNNIPFTDGTTAPPFFVCSKDTPEESSINCTKIKNLKFWWHCVAEGTMVTMEDGSQKPVEEINETHRVKSADGKDWSVSATVLGMHSSSPRENGCGGDRIHRMTTENGKSITATECHMVFVNDGHLVEICDVVAGDLVSTDEGLSKVISNEIVEHTGMFYGLLLGNIDELDDPCFPHNRAGFFAGGILTGDQQAMIHYCETAHHDLDVILPKIDEAIHTDYASALNDKRF